MESFSGKTAVVTGAASGIGFALAERFAREGMRLVLADIEEAALDSAVARLADTGAEAIGVVTDVAQQESVEALRDAALDAFGAVHVVLNNAAHTTISGSHSVKLLALPFHQSGATSLH